MLFLMKHKRDTKLYYAVRFPPSSIFSLFSKTFEISDYCCMFLRVIPKGSKALSFWQGNAEAWSIPRAVMPSPHLFLDYSGQIKRKQKKKRNWVGFLHTIFSKHERFPLSTLEVLANNFTVFFLLPWFDSYTRNNTFT